MKSVAEKMLFYIDAPKMQITWKDTYTPNIGRDGVDLKLEPKYRTAQFTGQIRGTG